MDLHKTGVNNSKISEKSYRKLEKNNNNLKDRQLVTTTNPVPRTTVLDIEKENRLTKIITLYSKGSFLEK
jgi:hypothetical protein